MKRKIIVALAEGGPLPEEFARLERVTDPLYVRASGECLAARHQAEVMLVWGS